MTDTVKAEPVEVPHLDVPGVYRIETMTLKEGMPMVLDMTRAVYPHDEIFGEYCTVNEYIDAPPDEVFDYLSDTRSLCEWTYSMRGFERTDTPDLWVSDDRIGSNTRIYTRTESSRATRTVDYHCAWDQGEHLWMIYLMRVVDAQRVLNKPGSVVLWTNCHHPFYDENAYPEAAPEGRPVWVGDFWHLFAAGHLLELRNLKAICEHRHANGLPIKPEWMD
ncbi:SRPBCC family protein [Nocardia sp. NBC_01503]|uniref:SRPBCC family protein n=1 Tax=Nocardia sp. NBC_01503 TaxID=2975997 RepID=UPI002E7B7DAB|nr:SRPBCC family protein [Nocardia sp. NBC_01503]WTL33521.1 SRPBCC family protein [Nocardia sp. NBC_01503]